MAISSNISESAPRILAQIKEAKNILLHCHPGPDPDSVGSSLAMKHVLTQLGKSVTMIKGDSALPTAFSSFPGFNDVSLKNFFEIDQSQYDLFLILDTASLGMVSRMQEVKFPPTMKTIVIDHHASNPGFADINFILPDHSSTAEVLFDLFKEWNIAFNHDIAACLFIGIYTDTGAFKYEKTTPETLRKAAELAAFAPDFTKMIFQMNFSNTKGRLLFDGLILSSVETYFNDSVAISPISFKTITKHGITEDEMSGGTGSSQLVTVKGWNIAITMIEKEPNAVRISMRSRDDHPYDVSLITAKLGGGGHKLAAGCRIDKPLAEAKQDVLNAIAEIFPELGKA